MKRVNSWFLVGGALLALCVAGSGVAAEDVDKSVNEKILDILLERGDITPERYDQLRKEALEEKQGATPPVAAGEPDPTDWKVYWNNGTRIERNDGLYKVKIGGRIQFDAAASGVSNRLRGMFPDSEGTGVEFRRARLFVEGEVWDHAIFKAQYDFAGSEAEFKDVYVGLQKIPYVGTVRAGHFKEPESIEMLTSSKYITFLERSLPVLAFGAERNSGIGVSNAFFDERMTFSVGGFRNVGGDGSGFDNQGNYNVGFRVTGLPLYEDDGEHLIHTGFWYSHQFRHGEMVSYDPNSESHLVGGILSMPDIDINGIDLLGGELAGVFGPFYAQSEFIASLVDGQQGVGDRVFYGTYITAGAFLTGEHRNYEKDSGAMGRTKVLKPFSLSKGQWGGVEVAGRWSYLTLNDGPVRGGIENNMTLGVNWYLYSNLRIMLNYVLAHRNGVGDANIFQSRVSFDF